MLAACAKTPPRELAPSAASCLPLAEANAAAEGAGQRNEQRFRDELAGKGLEIVAFERVGVEHGVEHGVQTELSVETRTIGGVTRRVLLAPSWTCATGDLQLAKNAQQELYSLAISKRGTNASITACGCRPPETAAPGCGGAHVAPITELYALSDELTYKGSIEIAYDVEPTSVLFTGRRPDGGDCPQRQDVGQDDGTGTHRDLGGRHPSAR